MKWWVVDDMQRHGIVWLPGEDGVSEMTGMTYKSGLNAVDIKG